MSYPETYSIYYKIKPNYDKTISWVHEYKRIENYKNGDSDNLVQTIRELIKKHEHDADEFVITRIQLELPDDIWELTDDEAYPTNYTKQDLKNLKSLIKADIDKIYKDNEAMLRSETVAVQFIEYIEAEIEQRFFNLIGEK